MSNPEFSTLVPTGLADQVPIVRYIINDYGERVPDVLSTSSNNRHFVDGGSDEADDLPRIVNASERFVDGSAAGRGVHWKTSTGEVRTPKSALLQPKSVGSGHKSSSVQIKEPPLTDTRSYYANNAVEGSTKWAAASDGNDEVNHGPLHSTIPIMPLGLAITCCILNILLPGSGKCMHTVRIYYVDGRRDTVQHNSSGRFVGSAISVAAFRR